MRLAEEKKRASQTKPNGDSTCFTDGNLHSTNHKDNILRGCERRLDHKFEIDLRRSNSLSLNYEFVRSTSRGIKRREMRAKGEEGANVDCRV